MKKQTQSQLAPYWSKLADGSMVHGLGTYKPPPEQFELSGVILGFLPKYMTSLLQVIEVC